MNSVSGMSSRCLKTWIVWKSSVVPLRNLNRRKSRVSGGGPRRSSIAMAEPKSAIGGDQIQKKARTR